MASDVCPPFLDRFHRLPPFSRDRVFNQINDLAGIRPLHRFKTVKTAQTVEMPA
jgi:hypothetical protein